MLIEDPTRGTHHRGPVGAGALSAGPELEVSPALSGSGVEGGYSPSDLRGAYSLPSTSGGFGQTVAVVDAYDDPKAESDLKAYRLEYGLSECTASNGCFRKVNATGGTSYPAPNHTWAREISLDLDMVSAICPHCHILLVEASSNEGTSLAAAENEAAALGATEISNSFAEATAPEPQEAEAYDHPGVPITAAAGDNGYGVGWPAGNANVIAVGGTTLKPAPPRGGWTESVWYSNVGEVSGSGSGCSASERKPAWQTDSGCTGRTINDVAAVADPNTPVSAYDSYETASPWLLLGGTSASTPIVAAAMALANPYTRSFDGAEALYLEAANGVGGFNDILSGRNGSCGSYLCEAGLGYDGPSGLGSLRGAPEVPPPTAVTEGASSIAQTHATLGASVNPHGVQVSACRFEYGPTASYGSVSSCSSLPGISTSPVSVSASATGLIPNGSYHFRVVVDYPGGSGQGADLSFTTPGSVPTISPEEPSALTRASVTLHAQINPNGATVGECEFEYGTTAFYGASAPCAPSPGAGRAPVPVSAAVAGLAANRTYHFRVVAANADGLSYGNDQTVTTLANPPAVVSEAPSAVTSSSATLNATVNANGVPVSSCAFEFASSETYIPCVPMPGSGESPVSVSAEVQGLPPGATFSYRIVASSAGGTSYGAVETFTTQLAPTRPQSPLAGAARLASTTLLVSASGNLIALVRCPAGHASCRGAIAVRTLTAVSVGGRASAKHILTLAAGSFAVAGGRVVAVALRLSPRARALFGATHSLRAGATLVTRGPRGPMPAWQAAVTLRRR